MTCTTVADSMTSILLQSAKIHLNVDGTDSEVIDCTAGVGGNTLSFSKVFKRVIAIELHPGRFRNLLENTHQLKHNNVVAFHSNMLRIITLAQFKKIRILFIDPPWGGTRYKYRKGVRLYISGIPLHDVVHRIQRNTTCFPRLVAIKVPTNFVFDEFLSAIPVTVQLLHNCRLPRMHLLVLIVRDIAPDSTPG
jgi:predicted RNA methylase